MNIRDAEIWHSAPREMPVDLGAEAFRDLGGALNGLQADALLSNRRPTT